MKSKIRKGILYMLCIGMILSIIMQKQRCDVFAVTEKIITWEEFRLMFPDERLYHIIDSKLKNQGYVKEGDPHLKFSCLELITDLRISDTLADNTNTEECMDLTGIEHLKKLKWLSIQIEVKSLKPICNLYKLQELTLGDNRTETIEELIRIAGLPSLWKLYIVSRKDNEPLDLSGIKKLHNLKELYVAGGGIKSLKPLENLHNLNKLNIYNVDNIIDLKDLSETSSLETISVVGCKNLKSIEGIEKNADTLKDMRLVECSSLQDISGLEALTELEYLQIRASNVTDISALSELDNLKTVFLEMSDIEDIRPLQNKDTIMRLGLGHTKIFCTADTDLRQENARVLGTLEGLVHLALEDTQAEKEDIRDILQLPNLSSLYIGGCKVTDLSIFSDLMAEGFFLDAWLHSEDDWQHTYLAGVSDTFVNPFVGIDGMPIVPNESNEYTYDSEKNTITLNEEYQELNKQYKISLTTKYTASYETEWEVQLGIYYTYGREPQETSVKQNETEEIKEIKTEINKEDETGINEKKKGKDDTDKVIIMSIFAGIILLCIFVCIEVRHHK